MELALKDIDRNSMLFIGKQIALTPENPGPIAVNLDSLTKEEVKQILFSIRTGVLSTEFNLKVLEEIADVGVSPEQVAPVPIETIKNKAESELSPRKKEVVLNKVLAKKIKVIKEEASFLSVSDLRKLIDIERSNKNRKSLLPFLIEMFASHTEQVAQNLKNIEDNSEKQGLTTQTFLDDLPDVVELDEKEVEILLPE